MTVPHPPSPCDCPPPAQCDGPPAPQPHVTVLPPLQGYPGSRGPPGINVSTVHPPPQLLEQHAGTHSHTHTHTHLTTHTHTHHTTHTHTHSHHTTHTHTRSHRRAHTHAHTHSPLLPHLCKHTHADAPPSPSPSPSGRPCGLTTPSGDVGSLPFPDPERVTLTLLPCHLQGTKGYPGLKGDEGEAGDPGEDVSAEPPPQAGSPTRRGGRRLRGRAGRPGDEGTGPQQAFMPVTRCCAPRTTTSLPEAPKERRGTEALKAPR